MIPLFLQKIIRLPRYYMLRVKRLKGNPEYIARGFALGVFMGNLPLVPQTLLLLPLTVFLKVSTLAAIISSVIVNNPFTVTFQYYIAWRLGSIILPGQSSPEHLEEMLRTIADKGLVDGLAAFGRLGFHTLLILLLGGLIMGLPLAIISYFLVRTFFRTMQEQRRKKHLLNNQP